MELLFQGKFDAYFEASAVGQGMCIFVHVPKTAGTSLRGELAEMLPPDVNIVVDYTDTARSFHERMDEAVERFLEQAGTGGVRFASGHVLGRHVERMRARLPGARFVTFLRDPVRRLISDYRYQRSPRHPVHEEFVARVPDLDAYLALESEWNKAAQHLIAPDVLHSRDPARCVEYMMQTYDFIGVQEMYPISFRTLTTLVGKPAWPQLRENVNDDGGAEQQVTPELVARIRAANPIDCALYDAVFPRWQAVREALAQRLA